MPSIPKADYYLDGPTFARAWLAAGAAGVASQADARLDRAVSVSRYTDDDGRTCGYVLAGVSLDLVVVAGVPVRGGLIGPQMLSDRVDRTEPSETWLVDDASGVGAPLIRAIGRAATKAAKKGGDLRVAMHVTDFTGPGGLDVGERALCIAADDITSETWVKISSFTPRDWRDAFPKPKAKPMDALASSFTEDPQLLHVRLARVFGALGARKVTWTVHELAPGRTAAVCDSTDDGMFVRIARFMDFTPAGATQAGFWDVPATLTEAADPNQLTTDDLDEDPDDAEARRLIEATFGPPGTDD